MLLLRAPGCGLRAADAHDNARLLWGGEGRPWAVQKQLTLHAAPDPIRSGGGATQLMLMMRAVPGSRSAPSRALTLMMVILFREP